MTKTPILTGAEVCVENLGGQNVTVQNLSEDTIWASAFPNVTAGADDVYEIPAGGGVVVLDARGTVYLVGTGKVQCTGTPYGYVNFKTPSSSASSGGGCEGYGIAELFDTADEKYIVRKEVHLVVGSSSNSCARLANAIVELLGAAWRFDSSNDRVLAENGIAINIRFNDYVTNADISARYGANNMGYVYSGNLTDNKIYISAIKDFSGHFIVIGFSNDSDFVPTKWAIGNFDTEQPQFIHIVKGTLDGLPYDFEYTVATGDNKYAGHGTKAAHSTVTAIGGILDSRISHIDGMKQVLSVNGENEKIKTAKTIRLNGIDYFLLNMFSDGYINTLDYNYRTAFAIPLNEKEV